MAKVDNIGIDLGTSNVRIYIKGKGVVLNEPAVIAMNRTTNKIIAVGTDAYRMIGRTPENILAVRPLHQGVISNFELTAAMLRHFVQRAVGRRMFGRPRAILSVPSGVSFTEKRNLCSIMFDAGMRQTQLIDRPIAAALGADIRFSDAYGAMIVDMGAGMSDIAVLSQNETVVSSSVPIGGDYFDDAIIRYLRKKNNLLIGSRTAEEIKIELGSAIKQERVTSMEVYGRSLTKDLPAAITITSDDVYDALRDPVADLIEAIQNVIEQTPPQLASDIFQDGIMLTGGAASLTGLPEAIHRILGIECLVWTDPQFCVVQGCSAVADNRADMRELLEDKRHWGH